MHTLRLKLDVKPNDESILEKRFRILAHISNQLRKKVKRMLSRLRNDEQYQQALQEYIRLKKLNSDDKQIKDDIQRLSKFMNDTRESIGLTKSGLEKYACVMQHRYKKNISSHQVQAEVKHIMKGVDAVLFGNRKDVHYKKELDFRTISGKSMSGVKIHFDQNDKKRRIDCYITWNGLTIPVKYDLSKADMYNDKNYVNEALSVGKIKYCEIVRLWFKNGWHYYVNLYMTENAPRKVVPGKSTIGIDEGPSTIAAVSEDKVFLEELSPNCKNYNKKIAYFQRKIDKSSRIMNPERYNDDGTCKKKSKDLPRWKFSKTCIRNKSKVRELYRKKSEYTKCTHENLLNRMIQNSSVFVNEPMEFKALAKKSKTTKRQEKASIVTKSDGLKASVHKYKRKKRFGKSITDRSPNLVISRLKQKCEQYGLSYLETDKWKYKASQYDHVQDRYIKTSLSERFKNIGEYIVQRDLYSAFLQSCMASAEKPDREKCKKLFNNFITMQNELINTMKATGNSYPSCFGF